ncbi:MAG: radical SAM protein [Fimbriimonas sp.]|nr:radical SAM protein [Fimbriimonas sp.]
MSRHLEIVLIKPSKYRADGYVERFHKGYMPNSTLPYMRNLTQRNTGGDLAEIVAIDEYVHTDTNYLSHLAPNGSSNKLVALVGVQSHQFHRALDLAALAVSKGSMAIIGGPHPMTCDTHEQQSHGVSFSLAEAELVWGSVLDDAAHGELAPVYGASERWQKDLDSPAVRVTREDLKRYVVPMLGVYPARGCPYSCSFCSVVKIAGHRIRSQSIETTLATVRSAKAAGVKMIMFTSDNFNKYSEAPELLRAMIEEHLDMSLFVQCDTQVYRQEELIELLARAGCFQMFVGVESFDRTTLTSMGKAQNRPEEYRRIVDLCRTHGIGSHFSNIIGFPTQDVQDVREHIAQLQSLSPTAASFYVLCPIPGTEQYSDLLADGLIVEKNLDRFDGTCLTWRHPQMSEVELNDLLFEAYRRFFSMSHLASNLRSIRGSAKSWLSSAAISVGNTAFHRWCAARRTHPMSGGIGRVRLDRSEEYLAERQRRFGVEMVPLPANLKLPDVDQAFNRRLNPRLSAVVL